MLPLFLYEEIAYRVHSRFRCNQYYMCRCSHRLYHQRLHYMSHGRNMFLRYKDLNYLIFMIHYLLNTLHKYYLIKFYYYSYMNKLLTVFTVVSSVTSTTCAEVTIGAGYNHRSGSVRSYNTT